MTYIKYNDNKLTTLAYQMRYNYKKYIYLNIHISNTYGKTIKIKYKIRII